MLGLFRKIGYLQTRILELEQRLNRLEKTMNDYGFDLYLHKDELEPGSKVFRSSARLPLKSAILQIMAHLNLKPIHHSARQASYTLAKEDDSPESTPE